jgi:hypothetical protein
MAIATQFTLTEEQIFSASKNAILNHIQGYYQILKMTKWVNEEYQQHYYEGIKNFITANIRVVDKFGKKKTLKVNIHPTMDKDTGMFTNTPNTVSCYSDSLWLNAKFNEVIDLELENVEFEDDFETAIAKRDEAIAESKRQDTLKKLKGDLNWNIKQRRSYKASKRTYAKYDMEDLLEFMVDLDENQREYLEGVIEAMNEKEEPKTVKAYLDSLVGAKREIFTQLEETFKESEEKVLANVIKWLTNEYKEMSFMTDERIEKEAKDYVEIQKMKLFYNAGKHLNNLDITSVEKQKFNYTSNGFEGTWKVNLEDGSSKIFETKSIIAGGYIQRMHYRYLSHLS